MKPSEDNSTEAAVASAAWPGVGTNSINPIKASKKIEATLSLVLIFILVTPKISLSAESIALALQELTG